MFLLWSLLFVACGPQCDEPGISCIALGTGAHGFAGEDLDQPVPAREARLYYPMDVTAWPDEPEDFVLVDWNNERVRLVQDGEIRTIIGTNFPGDGDIAMGDRHDPGARGTLVALNHPVSAEFAPDGRLYLAAWHNHKVRRWDPADERVRVTVANHDQTTGNNGGYSGDGGLAEEAHISFPSSIAFDAGGNYYIVDQQNLVIRRVDTAGIIDTFAGSGELGDADGDALSASFYFSEGPTNFQPPPAGAIEIDRVTGTIYLADTFNGLIRTLSVDGGAVSTLPIDGLVTPTDVELGPDGRLYIADPGAHQVFAADVNTGALTVVAGTGSPGWGEDGLPALETELNAPNGIDIASDGSLLIADTLNSVIRRVTP